MMLRVRRVRLATAEVLTYIVDYPARIITIARGTDDANGLKREQSRLCDLS